MRWKLGRPQQTVSPLAQHVRRDRMAEEACADSPPTKFGRRLHAVARGFGNPANVARSQVVGQLVEHRSSSLFEVSTAASQLLHFGANQPGYVSVSFQKAAEKPRIRRRPSFRAAAGSARQGQRAQDHYSVALRDPLLADPHKALRICLAWGARQGLSDVICVAKPGRNLWDDRKTGPTHRRQSKIGLDRQLQAPL